MNKYILGTANLGYEYGLLGGTWSRSASSEIMEYAWEKGIRHFDTSPLYGVAEEMIGGLFIGCEDLLVTSKIKSALLLNLTESRVMIQKSLKKLRKDRIDTLLIHSDFNPRLGQIIRENLGILVNDGLVQDFGISVYEAEELPQALDAIPEISTIQIPHHIADSRNVNSSYLNQLSASGKTITMRSVFSQGILLLDIEEIPDEFWEFKSVIKKLDVICREVNISRATLCMAYCDSVNWSTSTIVAANSKDQLDEILLTKIEWEERWNPLIEKIESPILDPRLWSK